MTLHENIYKTNQKYRNILRLAQYKLRRQEFIEKLTKDSDKDYLEAEMAEFNIPDNLKRQAI